MALGAFTLFRASFELASVWIGLVAIHTICEGKRLLEIAIDVTGRAADRDVFAKQGILRLRVVERKDRQKFFPPRCCVAVLTPLLEGSSMRIDMAVNASLELHVFVTRRSAGHVWLVTLFASDLDVETGQRVASLGMVKLLCCFPIREVVAGLALVSELALMRIFVARNAIL
jgi:hypothetical protein